MTAHDCQRCPDWHFTNPCDTYVPTRVHEGAHQIRLDLGALTATRGPDLIEDSLRQPQITRVRDRLDGQLIRIVAGGLGGGHEQTVASRLHG